MKFVSFEDIIAWQKGKELAVFVYGVTRKDAFARDFSLKDQIQRSAVSISSNIAEGFERQTNKEFKQFLFIAKGSTGEVRTQISIAYELGYITKEEFAKITNLSVEISKMLTKLTQYLQKET